MLFAWQNNKWWKYMEKHAILKVMSDIKFLYSPNITAFLLWLSPLPTIGFLFSTYSSLESWRLKDPLQRKSLDLPKTRQDWSLSFPPLENYNKTLRYMCLDSPKFDCSFNTYETCPNTSESSNILREKKDVHHVTESLKSIWSSSIMDKFSYWSWLMG